MNFWNFISQNRLEIADLTLEHLWMVGISTLLALGVGIPLGILISRRPA
jgi:osmoprotectant transport system permease protein